MLRILLIAIILSFAGLVVGLNLQTTPPSDKLPATNPSKNTQANLYKKLSLLEEKLQILENKLTGEIEKHNITRAQLNALKSSINTNIQTNKPQAQSNENAFTDTSNNTLPESQRNKHTLLAMGIDNETANRIQRLAENKEMEQLYLRNTAIREGWFGTEQYFEKSRVLDLSSNIYRQELGDEKYDQFLYSTNRTNRITIQSVLSESPAENAGLQAGDYILSYDNQRVFNWSELTALTANGEAGEDVAIEIQRDGQVFQYLIARGPLGIRLSSERINPNSP